MKRRLLTLLLSFSLLLSMCPAALAAEGDEVRETSFFTQQEHADVDFADMEYRHIDTGPVLAEIEAIRGLMEDETNAGEVRTRFNAVMEQLMELITMYSLVSIRHSQNVMDETASEELSYTNEAYRKVADAASLLIHDGLSSPCAGVIGEKLTEEDKAYYLAYEAMTEEQLAMSRQELDLENEYDQAAALISVEYNGEEWTEDDAYYAYAAGEISYEDYDAIATAYAKKQNEILGEIYLRMVPLRRKIAQSYGYDNYVDYAYQEIYQRDYTQEDVRPFLQAVKENGFYALSDAIVELFRSEADYDIYYADYTGEDSLDLVESYIDRMSGEMGEAFDYMRAHHLYDIGEGAYKDGTGYTTTLYTYGAPFFFNTPGGYLYDFTTIVHEFGHYNESYWASTSWDSSTKSHDIAEVHSQGLELLFSHWYDEIFEDGAQFVLDFQLANLVGAIGEGAIHDELQQYVYATEDVTLEQINRKYRQLAAEYGIIDDDDPREEMYSWVRIPHTFASPCYYISYAVSAAGAFSFWLDAREGDYYAALDEYLKFTSLPAEYGFQDSFARLGMETPLSPEYLTDLAQTLWEVLDLEARISSMAPADLAGDEWFYDAVSALYSAGLIEKDGNNCVYPYNPATWEDIAVLLSAITGEEFEAAESGAATITRAEFSQIMAALLELPADEASPFSDTDDAAVATLARFGIVSGYPDGTFRPEQSISRAEMCVIVYRVLMTMVDQLMGGMAA